MRRLTNPPVALTDSRLGIVSGGPSGHLVLVDVNGADPDDAVKAFVWFSEPEGMKGEPVVFSRLEKSAARHGFGPPAYEAALDRLRRQDVWLLPGDQVSREAQRLWQRFSERASGGDMERYEVYPDDETVDGERVGLHNESELDAMYRLKRKARGAGGARNRGDSWVRRYAREAGLTQGEVEELLWEAGESLFGALTYPWEQRERSFRVTM